ncbi:hypothetical protein IL54_1273 [Sphingobium sp. ba1]|nr:hypothetical protein IL54_1273 [Sphingobium sp. ba1]
MRLVDPSLDRFGYGWKDSFVLLHCTITGSPDASSDSCSRSDQ